MIIISNFFIDFSINEKIITKLLEFQTSNWNVSRIRIDPRNLPANSYFVELPESAGLASATDHFYPLLEEKVSIVLLPGSEVGLESELSRRFEVP